MESAPLRVLAVQTTPRISSEVNVLRTLLSASPQEPSTAPPLDVLLAQGIEGRSANDREAACAFSDIPGVTLLQVPMGRLGREGLSRAQRAAKVADVARLRVDRRRLLQAARDFRPQVVYSAQQRWDQRLAVMLAQRLDVPRVVHLHYIVGPWLGADAVESLQSADMVIGVSNFICDNAVAGGVARERTHALHNAISVPDALSVSARAELRQRLRAELSVSPDAVLVGMVGRLSASKCQVELLDAMVPILDETPDVHLVLVGTEYPTGNGIAERLQERAVQAGIAEQLHLLGQRSDVAGLLDAFDVFAHPSLLDPCPLAVLEAMAHGLPLVVWNDGGPAELVLDGETGILVPPKDVDRLTDALAALIGDEEMRSRMGRPARHRVTSSFRPDGARERFRELLECVASSA